MTNFKRYIGGAVGACVLTFGASTAHATTVTYDIAGKLGGYVQYTYNPNPFPIYQETRFELDIARGDLVLTYDDKGTASASDDVATLDGTTTGCFGYGCNLSNIGSEIYGITASLVTTKSPFGFQLNTDVNGDLAEAVRLAVLGGVIFKTGVQYALNPDGTLYNWSFQLFKSGSSTNPPPGGGGGGGGGSPVPEPATITLLGAGAIGLARRRRIA